MAAATRQRLTGLGRGSVARPGRADALLSTLPVWIGALAALGVVWFVLPSFYVYLSVLVVFACIGATGLNLLMGSAGLVSIGNAGFMAVGAFAAVWGYQAGGFLVALLAAGVVSGAAGFLVGAVSMRLRGFYLVLSTLALQYIVAFIGQEIEQHTNHPAGFELPLPSLGLFQLQSDRHWFFFGLILLVAQLLTVHFVMRGRVGRGFLAIREYENAASVAGVNVPFYKLLAFTISSAMIGVGGAVLAFYIGNVDYGNYTLDVAVSYAAMVLIGGLGSKYGPLLGAVLITPLPALLAQIGGANQSGLLSQDASSIELLVYGLLIVAIVLIEPGGLAVLVRRVYESVFAGRGRQHLGSIDEQANFGGDVDVVEQSLDVENG